MSDKRIIDLEAKQTLGSGDYLAADSAQGTYKVDANTNIMTPLTNVRNNVANSSASPDKYSSSTAYKVGDMVIHDDILYICTTACSAASWAVNSACFTATTLSSAITQLNSDLKWIDITSNITFASALNWATKKAFYNKATKEVWIEGQVSSNGLDYDSAIINISNYPPNRNFLTAGSSNRYYMPGYAMARFSPSISSTTSTNYFSVTLQLTSNNEVKVMYPSTTTAYAHKFSIRYITTV